MGGAVATTLGVLAGILLVWLALVVALLIAKPRGGVREAVRLLPDLLRLVGRLTTDRSLPGGVRVRLGLLAVYLAIPIDVIPDFVPVLGYADDAIAVAWTLRSVTRRVGLPALRQHWPGTEDGFAALVRLCGLEKSTGDGWRLGPDVLLVAGFAALTLTLADRRLLGLDLAIRNWCDARTAQLRATYWLARGLNYVGQGLWLTLIAAGLAVLVGWRARSVRPILPVAAAYLVTYATLGPLKLWLDRSAPHRTDVPHPERLFTGGLSYPSGHTTNAVVWYFVLVLLLGALWPGLSRRVRLGLRIAPVVIVTATTVYLGFHWLTDDLAGILLGLLIARTLARVPWDRVPLGGWLRRRGLDGPFRSLPRSGPAA
jgi:membrane-associated phospholipid phosphatase/uncharacterized membrane protein YkvA (DUF1232 family)